MEEAERGKREPAVPVDGTLSGSRTERSCPIVKNAAAQMLTGATVKLFDERSAPARRNSRMGKIAVDVTIDRVRKEFSIISAPRTENGFLFAVPVGTVRSPVIRLMHMLVDTEIEFHLMIPVPVIYVVSIRCAP
jgi:hypothetical protein